MTHRENAVGHHFPKHQTALVDNHVASTVHNTRRQDMRDERLGINFPDLQKAYIPSFYSEKERQVARIASGKPGNFVSLAQVKVYDAYIDAAERAHGGPCTLPNGRSSDADKFAVLGIESDMMTGNCARNAAGYAMLKVFDHTVGALFRWAAKGEYGIQ